jgi:NTP pyrophosphatase (non-canonical NTP hydrolase)
MNSKPERERERMALSLKEIMTQQAEFDADHASPGMAWSMNALPDHFELIEHTLVCLLGELGEFANEVKRVAQADRSLDAAMPQLKAEMADTFIYLVKICNQLDLDLESLFVERLAYNRIRFAAKATR